MSSPMTISLWDFTWYTRTGPGEPFADLGAAFAQAVERGYDTVRICAMPYLLFGSGLDTSALRFTGLGGEFGQRTRWYDVPSGPALDGRAHLLELFRQAKAHACRIIVSSWEYQQSPSFGVDDAWHRALQAVPRSARTVALADAHASLVDFVRAEGLDDVVAFVELHNEVQYSGLNGGEGVVGLRDSLERGIDRFKQRHPSVPVTVNYSRVPVGEMRGLPRNMDVAVFHPYVYGVLGQLYDEFALRDTSRPYPQERAFAELLRDGAPTLEDWRPPESWKSAATIVPHREIYTHDWCDPAKWDRWLYDRYGAHRVAMRETMETWLAVAADHAAARGIPLVFGEGWVGYTPLHASFEEGPVGAEICAHAMRTARSLGAWGTVVCSNAAPHHPMWQDVALQQRRNAEFRGESLTMWTIAGASTEYTVAAAGDRIDLVAWGPHGVSDGPSPVAFHGKVQYLLPGDVAAVEYAPDGLRPFLGADLAVAGQVLTWRFDSMAVDDGLAATFVDEVTGLRVVLRWRFAAGTDVVERWAVVHNDGPAPVSLTRLGSAGFCVPTPFGADLSYLCGQWAEEFTPASTHLARGRFEIGSAQGVTGHQFAPYLAVSTGDAVYGVGLAWTGSWQITADVDAAGLTRVRVGRSLEGAPVTLAPGASVTAPTAAGAYAAGLDGLARQWHSYQRSLAGDRLRRTPKVIYNSWEATTFDVTAQGQLALADIAASLGVETFVVDDGWFVGRDDDHGGLGDWTPDPAKFPDGFGAFVSAVRSRGLEFGLWVEPEMVNPKSALYAAHPDWVYQAAGRPLRTIRNQYLLDLGRPDVYEFVLSTLDSLLSAYPISYLKWDFNRPRTEADRSVADLDGAHVHNLYRVLDHLRAAHPAVTIEGCAAGGARVDLAMAARADVLWPSDNTAPLDRLRIQHGFLSAFAPHLMSSWVTDADGMFDERSRSLAFRFVLACAGVLGIGADITKWTAAERTEAASWVARYKSIREVITRGKVHRIGGPGEARCAVQYTFGDRVAVLAWNSGGLDGLARVPSREIRLPLRDLDPASRYRSGEAVYSGSHLMSVGLPIRWTPTHDADMVILDRLRA